MISAGTSETRDAGRSRGVSGWPARWAGSRRSVRLRLTAIYGALFLACGAALLTITYLLVEGAPFGPPRHDNPPAISGNAPIGIAVERNSVLHALLLRSGIALAIMVLVSVWLGWIVAGRVLAPLRVITARTRDISQENLHDRLVLAGPDDEIKELSDTIDGLLARLEGAFLAQRRFVANVSHELRTPLAMMRTSLDVAAAKPRPMSDDASVVSAKVREGLDHADRLVESFLVLARAEADGIAELETVSLPQLVRAALEARGEGAEELNLTVRARLEPAQVAGSGMLIARLVANLVDNAVRHNRPDGMIGITTEIDGATARLTVEGDGRPIDPEQAWRLAEPFRRVGADRTRSEDGLGLGLAIVSAIATAHHGTLDLRARPDGGLTAVVALPRAGGLTAGAAGT
jgi:signal transduction histidine kinase